MSRPNPEQLLGGDVRMRELAAAHLPHFFREHANFRFNEHRGNLRILIPTCN